MGLDQYAYARPPAPLAADDDPAPAFVWRKHAKLQEWAEALFMARTGGCADTLNCGELELTLEDVDALERLVREGRLPESPGGFFYGHQHQDESAREYRAYDLEFCAWARERLMNGQRVVYSCWW